jgi:hypothetical protein
VKASGWLKLPVLGAAVKRGTTSTVVRAAAAGGRRFVYSTVSVPLRNLNA